MRRALPLVIILLALSSDTADARPGDLDPAFAGGKPVTIDLGSSEQLTALALSPDQKIVAAGDTPRGHESPQAPSVVLVRLNADGSRDRTFGVDGVSISRFGDGGHRITDMLLQPDGKIVVVGVYQSYGSRLGSRDRPVTRPGPIFTVDDVLVARFDRDGSPDTSFGTGGSQILDLGGNQDSASGVALQPDGRIVVAATEEVRFTTNTFDVLRLTADGQLDTSFGTGGRVTQTFGDVKAAGRAVTITTGGRIFAGGAVGVDPGNSNAQGYRSVVAALRSDGTLDPAFGINGVVTGPVGEVRSLQEHQGRLLVGLSKSVPLMQLTLSGALDQTFGAGGLVGFERLTPYMGPALAPDGRLVLAGALDVPDGGGAPTIGVARYQADGRLDSGYGRSGFATPDLGSGIVTPYEVGVQRDDATVLVGTQGANLLIARLLGGERCTPRSSSALSVSRAVVAKGTLRVRGAVSRQARGSVRITYRAAGRTSRFSARIRTGRIVADHRLTGRLAQIRNGQVTVAYPGDKAIRGFTARVRAGGHASGLAVQGLPFAGERLTGKGRASRRATGRVTVEYQYSDQACVPRTVRVRGRIRNGRWTSSQKNAGALKEIAVREGPVQAYVTYAGSAARNIRGAVRSLSIAADR